ncbi:MAG: DUF3857 domain-containing protein [Marinoscillum sp.]
MRYSLIFIYSCLSYGVYAQSTGSRIAQYSEHITVENGSHKREVSYLIEINDQESNWLGDIEIYHDEGDKYKLLEAELLDYTQVNTIRKIKKKDIETISANSRGTFFDDRLVDKFSLKHNEYPYYIKYSYSIESQNFLYVSYWVPRKYNAVPVTKSRLTVTRPANFEIAIDSIGRFEYTKTQDPEKSDWLSETWSIENPKKVEQAPFSSPNIEELDQIQIVPLQFTYGVSGRQDSWEQFGDWISRLNDGLDDLPPMETSRLKTKFGHLKDTVTLIKSLYNYLQDNTRYINVSLDIGGLKSYPASYVLNNQYGDCKALTMYMKALLKVFNIPSYYTIIEAGDNAQRIDINFPSQQFNHVILCVPTRTDTLWLENTSSSSPFNYLGTFTQNRTALLANGLQSKLVRTPPLTPEDVRVVNHFNLGVSGTNLTGTLRILSKGEDFESFAYVSRFYNSKDQLNYAKSYLGKWNTYFINPEISIPNRNVNSGKLTADVNFQQAVKTVANKLILIDLPNQKKRFSAEDFKNRTRNIRFTEPIHIVDSIEIDLSEIPEAFVAVPRENTEVNFPHGQYKCSYEISKTKALIVRVLKTEINESLASDQSIYYDFFESITNEEKKPLVFKKE